MLDVPYAKLRNRPAAICAALGVASALAFGGAMVAPTMADAASSGTPVNTLVPKLAGSAAAGSVITLTPGTFSNETTQTGTWERCTSATSTTCAATTNSGYTYTLSAGDPSGDYIRLQETATNGNGSTTTWSNAIGAIGMPVNTLMPKLAGSTARGSAITLTPGTFSNETTQNGIWEQCPSATSTACTTTTNTGSAYTLGTNDPVGNYVRLDETATNGNGSTSVWSNAVGPVTGAPISTQAPKLVGSPAQGSVITLTPGTFSNGTTQTETWEQCPTVASTACTAIANTGNTHTLSTSDPVGDYLRVDEAGTNTSGSTTVWSNVVGPITGAAASSGYTGGCTKTISPPTDPAITESSMSPGQTLCLNSGTYDSITESEPNYFNGSGTAGNPIVVTSAPGQTATIKGSDWLQGAWVTYQYLNLDVADTLGDQRTSAFVGCPTPASLGVELDASNDVLQDNNIYESVNRDELIGVNYAGSSTPVVNDVITHNNLGPAGSCKQLDHLIYDDYSTGLQITQNWFFDDPYGYGVQLYVGPTNTTVTGNVFDDVLDGIIAASSNGGNTIQHNVGINLPNVSGYASGMLINCYQSGAAIASNNAVCSAANGFGAACGSLQITGTNPTLAVNPFLGGECSDSYKLASNAAATSIAGYGLWDGQGPPSPNPATSYPKDPPNPGPSAFTSSLSAPLSQH